MDRPCLEYIVAEAVDAGIEEFIFVTSRGKDAITDYFDRSPSLEANLEAAGKEDYLREVRRVGGMAEVVSIRQKETLGLGHAVLCAAPATGDETFAVLLGDDIVDSEVPAIGQLMEVHQERGGCVVALMDVPREQRPTATGSAMESMHGDRLMHVSAMVEKPEPAEAPSTYSIVGRYILPPEIHEILRRSARRRRRDPAHGCLGHSQREARPGL